MKIIPLSQGLTALVSDEDFNYLNQWKWYAARRSGNTFYARRMDQRNGKRKLVFMHRVVTRAPEGKEVDHINHNTLDNRRENLRVCTHYENMQNRSPPAQCNGPSSSVYRGVRLFEGKYWRAQIHIDGRFIHLGSFRSEKEAARAYDEASRKYRPNSTNLNFPGETP